MMEGFLNRAHPGAFQHITSRELTQVFMEDWGNPELAFERRQHLVRGWTAPNTREGNKLKTAELLAADKLLSEIFVKLEVPTWKWLGSKTVISKFNAAFLSANFGIPGGSFTEEKT